MNELLIFLVILPLGLIILGLLVWSLIWVYGDAEKRGKPGWLVALLVLLLDWPISLLVWMLLRPDLRPN